MELKIEHLSKQFKDKTAVNDVNLTLTPGVWGLLGANGAGKTTLMRMIADIMTPTILTGLSTIRRKRPPLQILSSGQRRGKRFPLPTLQKR